MYVWLEMTVRRLLSWLGYVRGWLLAGYGVRVAWSARVARHVRAGAGTVIEARADLFPWDRHITLGRNCYVGVGCWCIGEIEIGDNCLIAPGVKLVGQSHVFDDPARLIREQGRRKAPIRIGDDVWLGANAVVLTGVTIGRGAVVGAGAVVTRDVPPFAVVAGVPARVVKMRRAEDGGADREAGAEGWAAVAPPRPAVDEASP